MVISCEPLESRRLLSAGQLDPTFGVGGTLHAADTGKDEFFIDAALAPDGKLIVLNDARPSKSAKSLVPAIYRYNADGKTLDTTFGAGGIAFAPDTFLPVTKMAVLPDGAIILAMFDGSVARFTSDGKLDLTFGGEAKGNVAGTVAGVAHMAGTDRFRNSNAFFAVAPDGRIAMAVSLQSTYEVEMFTADGAPDTAFDHDGLLEVTAVDPLNQVGVNAIAFQSDGTLVVGTSYLLFAVDPFDPPHTGEINLIDKAGMVTRPADSPYGQPVVLAIGADDSIFTLNLDDTGNFLTYWFHHLESDAAVDDLRGKLVAGIEPTTLAVFSDGRTVIGGVTPETDNQILSEILLARLTPQGDLDPTFGTGGIATGAAIPRDPSLFPFARVIAMPTGGALIAGKGKSSPQDTIVNRVEGDPTIRITSAGTLIVGGTSGDDAISIYRRHRDGRIVARVGGVAHSLPRGHVTRIRVYAGSGNDMVSFGESISGAYVDGGDGNDTIVGTSGDDVLIGGAGSDRLTGGSGEDTLMGGSGNDYLLGSAGNDRLFGEGGIDTLSGAGGNDRFFGGAGADRILGGAGTDSSESDANDDKISIETLLI